MKSDLWYFGKDLPTLNTSKMMLKKPTLINNKIINGSIKQMNGSAYNLIYFTEDNKFHSIGRENYHGFLTEGNEEINNDPIVQVSSGYHTNAILTKSGKVFLFSDYNSPSNGSLENFQKPKEYTYFKDNNITSPVTKLSGGEFQNFFLLENGDFYGFGSNSYKQFQPNPQTIKKHKMPISQDKYSKPTLISENVILISDSVCTRNCLYLTSSWTLWAQGDNNCSGCGVGQKRNIASPRKVIVKGEDNRNLRKIAIGLCFSVLLFDSGLYSCGMVDRSGHTNDTSEFTKLEFFNEIQIENVVCGCSYTIVLSKDSQVYGFGQIQESNSNLISRTPIKIKIPDYNRINPLGIGNGVYSIPIFTVSGTSLAKDFLNLYESQEFTDFEINGFKIHKYFVEFRLDSSIEKIQQILKKYSKEETNIFLIWLYSGLRRNSQLVNTICSQFGIQKPELKKLKDDLKKLYKEEETKDFKILVQDVDDLDDENEYEDEDDAYFEEIPVHKFILLARSGLFRELFKNISKKENEISNSVKDYSKKSIESLEILIRYFYNDDIELTADDDPQLVFDELSDAAEYYQLSENNNFNSLLELIKIQFKINEEK
ncbi:hypothetical protein M0812_25630 [Anaeramoeba flamelloides]|uniref:BTB domain-containing protein n=1 Tax=Anaeramoeba flamelloides TaxID=1746091 RepID=A0AAV7YH71_9EUKA|nr:hypothetical protein M0812_25630 [Anaeramoeba flamelloides]